jgi:Zn-dependent M32 family carboxypeptidase
VLHRPADAPTAAVTVCWSCRSWPGHALYEQGRNLGPEWEGLPVNSALSMGIHESQSLFWERMVRYSANTQLVMQATHSIVAVLC